MPQNNCLLISVACTLYLNISQYECQFLYFYKIKERLNNQTVSANIIIKTNAKMLITLSVSMFYIRKNFVKRILTEQRDNMNSCRLKRQLWYKKGSETVKKGKIYFDFVGHIISKIPVIFNIIGSHNWIGNSIICDGVNRYCDAIPW